MNKEIRIFFTALMFLTRLPVPRMTDHSPEYLEKSSRYFPLIGWIVGGISAFVLLLALQFLSVPLAVLAMMIASILTTGAFHEDGFADVCDGFGGGWTKQKILDIMKDSRLGTYGTTGLVSVLAAKFLLLTELLPLIAHKGSGPFWLQVAGSLLAAHALSRFMAVASIQFYPYVTPDDVSKSKPSAAQKLTAASFLLALLFALAPFSTLPLLFVPVIFVVLCIVTLLMNRYFKKWIGGHTGDCLGAIQQTTEIICYLSMLLLWKYT